MKTALFANSQKPQAQEILNDLSHFLRNLGVTVVLESAEPFTNGDLQDVLPSIKKADFLVSIGGDGSILHLIHAIGIPHIPIVGINLGSLGFLAEVNVKNLFNDFETICKGGYTTEERLVIDGYIHNTKSGFAVNEVTVHRGCLPNLIDLSIHVDGVFLNTFSADGVIVSTPSGSTAYSLSAGGPIVTPEIEALIITPICPHTMSNRPLVVMPKESLSIELSRGGDVVDVAFDGQPPTPLSRGESLEIRRSSDHFRLLTLPTTNYFSTLRSKLGWAGSWRQ